MMITPVTRNILFRSCLLMIWPASVLASEPGTPDLPASAGSYHLTYAEEFNDNSTATDLAGWTYDIGNGSSEGIPGWGNSEDEYYTNSSANISVSTNNGVGALNINVLPQTITSDGYTTQYTSARIESTNVFTQTYGVIEFRAELPAGQGLWPAVWMLPDNASGSSSPLYGGWPTSGEIDILESTGQSPTLVQGSLHSGVNSGSQDTQSQTFSGSGAEPSKFTTNTWHTYDLVWTAGSPGSFQWYVDGTLYETQTGGWVVPSGAPAEAPFNQPFHLLINLAVGEAGDYAGAANLNSNTPYTMSIDYIQSYTSGYLLGDTNNDGVVNATDLATVMANYGKSVTGGFTSGDFNGDGVVNADDVALYELGASERIGATGPLPEPGTLALLALPWIALRRRGQRGASRFDKAHRSYRH
jgi:beta-glucanase (GH16 family)